MKVKLLPGAFAPTRAHEDDAGLDIRTPFDFVLKPRCSQVIPSRVCVEIPKGYVGMLKSKSGLNVSWDIVGEGVIDCGYTGEIVVKLYNNGDLYKEFKKGDKIIQLVVIPCNTEPIEIVEELEDTERGAHGFGSTGR